MSRLLELPGSLARLMDGFLELVFVDFALFAFFDFVLFCFERLGGDSSSEEPLVVLRVYPLEGGLAPLACNDKNSL